MWIFLESPINTSFYYYNSLIKKDSNKSKEDCLSHMRTFKFVVFPGNNSFIIKEALLQRGNWKEVGDLMLFFYSI